MAQLLRTRNGFLTFCRSWLESLSLPRYIEKVVIGLSPFAKDGESWLKSSLPI